MRDSRIIILTKNEKGAMGVKVTDSIMDRAAHRCWYFIKNMIPWKSFIFLGAFIILVLIDYLAVTGQILTDNTLFRETIVISLTTGIIGSFLFLLLIFTLKPSIAISPFILVADSIKNPGEKAWTIKFVNCNWFFNMNDVKIALYEVQKIPQDALKDKENFSRRKIEVTTPYSHYINSRVHKKWRKFAENCFVTGTSENLTEILKGKNTLEFEIVAKHELSGFSIVRKQEFKTDKQAVFEGEFAHGDNFLIL